MLAVFSTRELAEKALPKYGGDAEIEEFRFDPEIPDTPAGMTGFSCYLYSDGSVAAYCAITPEMAERAWANPLVDSLPLIAGTRCVYVWARDKDHAIKIASEKFARLKAIDAGIAC